jgi:spore germination protein KC
MRRIKYFAIILLLLVTTSILTGCYDAREIDNLSYAIAVGLDKGKTNKLMITIQYAIPLAFAGSGGGSGGGAGAAKPLGVVTLEAPTIYSGIDMVNNFFGKQLSMSHAQVIVISKQLAESEDMGKYLHALIRGREFRPNIFFAVSRDSAESYIQSIVPIQESNPTKYYQLKFSTYEFTGLTVDSRLSDIYNHLESDSIDALATLVGVGKYDKSSDIDALKSTAMQKQRKFPLAGDYLAGDIPKTGDVKGETLGVAVFSSNKMVGMMDGEETTMYLMASGKYQSSYMTFDDPEDKNSYVVLNLKQSRKPTYKISNLNKKPEITLNIILEGDYLSIQSGIEYDNIKYEKFQKSAEQYIKNEMLNFLNKTTKKFGTDICGFGRYVKMSFLTLDEWEKYKWLSKYKDATFNVAIDLKIRRTGLMIRTR